MIDIAPTDERCGLPSASSMERIALCPGSLRASKGLVEIKTPEMAEMGRAGDRGHLWLECPGFIDLAPEELELAEEILAERNALLAEHGFAGKEQAEQRLWFTNAEGEKQCSARLDYSNIDGKRAFICEYKTGYGDQTESARNLQLRTQAVILDWNQPSGYKFTEVLVAVIQPRVSRKPEVASYTAKDILKARGQLRRYLEAAKAPDAPRIPGKKQCQFCPAKLGCPENQRVMNSLNLEELIGITAEALSNLLDRCDVAQQVIDGARSQARALLAENSDAIPNWRLGEPGSVRHVPDAAKLYEALFRSGLIDQPAFIAACKVGITDLSKGIHAYRKTIEKMTHDEIKEALTGFPDLIISKPKAAPLERITT